VCGIFGAIKLNGSFEPNAFDRFAALTDKVSYRGPDDSDCLAFQSSAGQVLSIAEPTQPFDVFLGHRRLSIIDLSPAGRQPMTDGRGCWIIFNGEIFNFVELREELKSLGSKFRTGTDTEVILQLYDQFGEAGFEKMNGMWALAIVDLRSRRVVLSRDRFSIKPFYWLAQGDELYFASEIKQLLPLLPNKEPNLTILSTFLMQGLLDHSLETFFCGISRIPPKTNLVVHLPNGAIEKKAYWEYGNRKSPSLATVQDEFRELLVDSTRIRLRSDVKVGLLLSGGLDSSSLAVSVGLTGVRNFETYSVVSDEKQFNEEAFIDVVNRSLDLKGIKFRFQIPHLEDTLLKVLHHSDEPFAGFSVVAQFGIFQTIKANSEATVLLSGQGADEVLLGYSKFFFFHLFDLLRKGRYGSAVGCGLLGAVRRPVLRQFRLSEAKRYIPFFHSDHRSVLRGKYAPVPVWANGDMRARQIADLDAYSVPALAHYEDRNSMAHSLEVRHPFLDHRIVDFALSLPPECQFKQGWTKSLLRRSLPELPAAVRWRRDKQGFTTPEELWLRRELAGFIEQTLRSSLLDQWGLVDARAFLKQYRSFCRGNPLVSFGDISRVLIAEVWAQQHWGQTSRLKSISPRRAVPEPDSPSVLSHLQGERIS
jgi:asparagine synthase (glutamine-hydrolysing)